MSLTNRTFGVELEFIGASMTQVSDALNAAGIPCRTSYYNSPNSTSWKVQGDGSVHAHGRYATLGGGELVSPILTGEEGLAVIRRVCAVLATLNVTANRTCGFHVHFGIRDLSHDQVKKVCKTWIREEAYIDLLMPESRRANNARYCQSNLHGTVEEMFRQIDAARSFPSLQRALNPNVGNGPRYHKLNLCAFPEHGTLEFRQHSGTVEADKVCYWVEFLDAMIATAISMRSVRLRSPEIMNAMTPVKRIAWIASGFSPSKACHQYLIGRAKHFVENGTTRVPVASVAPVASSVPTDTVAVYV